MKIHKISFLIQFAIFLLIFVFFKILLTQEIFTINIKFTFTIYPSLSDEVGEIVSLTNIEEILSMNGYSLSDFNLPTIVEDEKKKKLF